MKRLIKVVIAGFIYYSGLLKLFMTVRAVLLKKNSGIILLYHRVVDLENYHRQNYQSQPGIVVSKTMFEKQVAFLLNKHVIISLEKLVDSIKGKSRLPLNSIVITFDDGWRDNYQNAFPILKKLKIPGTIFLSTGFIGTSEIFWPEKTLYLIRNIIRSGNSERLSPVEAVPDDAVSLINDIILSGNRSFEENTEALIARMKEFLDSERDIILNALERHAGGPRESDENDRSILNWAEISEMKEAGITFGSHGVTHSIFTKVDELRITEELTRSRNEIREKTGERFTPLSYPNGNYNDRVIEIAKDLEYDCALTVESGYVGLSSDLFRLKRVNLHDNDSRGIRGRFSPALFACRINGLFS